MNPDTINPICIILWALGGIIAFGGFFSLSIDENKEGIEGEEVFDLIAFGGILTSLNNASKNWNTKKEAKWLFLGGISMVGIGLLVWIL